MEQKQFLTNEQINAILNVIMRDSVNQQVDDAIKAVVDSEEFKTKLEEIKNSKENLEEVSTENTRYQNNIKAFELFQQLKAIDTTLVTTDTEWGDKNDIHWLVSTTLEDIQKNHEAHLDYTNSNFIARTKTALDLNSPWTIRDQVREDLKARLLLITPSDYDAVVTDIVKYININKYLRS